jgi:hypothetical protein
LAQVKPLFALLKALFSSLGSVDVYVCVGGGAANSQQLTGAAGANQVKGAEVAMTQNIGGAGASVYTHVFVKE